jgi:Domain of unknown function (DUF222)/HNH endonuclease
MLREQSIARADAANARVGAAQRDLLSAIGEIDRMSAWEGDGARDLAHWVSIRYGISQWKGCRWVHAAHALETLPRIADALARGELSLDQVVELCRFATPETEAGLIRWAKTVSTGALRRRADREVATSTQADRDAEEARFLRWWYLEEGRRMGLEAELPAAQGAIVVKAIERMAKRVPTMPGEEDPVHMTARRADALVAICSSRIAADPEPDRATVLVHVRADTLDHGRGAAEVENGPLLHLATTHRLLCDARVQTVIEGEGGSVVGLGRMRREPSAWMVRQIRYRDRECRFPGCGARRFTQAHHIRWWRDGGSTDLDNLLLICSFQHKLVHELGWRVKRRSDGEIRWFRPDGVRYRAGPEITAVS